MDVEISCVTCLLHTIFENIMGLGEANDEWGSISTTDLILNLLEISVMVFNQQIEEWRVIVLFVLLRSHNGQTI